MRIAPHLLVLAVQLWSAGAAGQELEPRAFSPAPVGTKFYLGGFGVSQGAYVVDAGAPIQNVSANVSFAVAAVGYTFAVAGRQVRFTALLPYAWGGVTGEIGNELRSRALEGFGDPRLKLSAAITGGQALTREQFALAKKRTVIGAGLTVVPPFGQYDSHRLVNLGFNRWAFKPEIGVWHPAAAWTFDGSAGVWLVTANDAYFPGTARRTQDAMLTVQGHVSRDFENGMWIALDAAWFGGGETRVDGTSAENRRDSVRLGATLSLPVGDGHSLKLTYSTGLATRRGADFDTIGLTWQIVMF